VSQFFAFSDKAKEQADNVGVNKQDDAEAAEYRDYLQKAITGKLPKATKINVCQTPQVYVKYGLHNSSLSIQASLVKKATTGKHNDHNVNLDTFERLQQLVRNQLAIFKSLTEKKSLVAVINAQDQSGRQVIVILTPKDNGINMIPSLYGKDDFNNFLERNFNEGTILAADKTWVAKNIRPTGLQLPLGSAFDDLDVQSLSPQSPKKSRRLWRPVALAH
jgi:hypothetical protein